MSKRNIVRSLLSTNQTLIGAYCGLWTGDGSQYYSAGYRIKICLHSGNKELISFVQEVLLNLFGKKTRFVDDHGEYSGFVIFNSKFIYEFVDEYMFYAGYKTKTVCLKKDVSLYEREFLEGFFLGLMLSDGYLKDRCMYQTISIDLAKNLFAIFCYLGFEPYFSRSKRSKYGWNDLYCVYLNRKFTVEVENLLTCILNSLDYTYSFKRLKGYKN